MQQAITNKSHPSYNFLQTLKQDGQNLHEFATKRRVAHEELLQHNYRPKNQIKENAIITIGRQQISKVGIESTSSSRRNNANLSTFGFQTQN